MSEDLSKIALISGKLNGTKTLKNFLEDIENPDEIEEFLKSFINYKIDFDTQNEIIYINDNQSFSDRLNDIEDSGYISIYTNDNFTSIYITTDSMRTYVLRPGKINNNLIAKLFSKEKPIKFLFNSFNFIKWCNSQKIDVKNMYDIPTYIKILTNELNPFKSIDSYITEYTDYTLDDNNKNNMIIIGNFILNFGKYLNSYVVKFNVDSICKLITENSYYEAQEIDNKDSCTLKFRYLNLREAIEVVTNEKEKAYKDKAYVLSPNGRIALKFGHNVKDIIEELYAEDTSITILNELYNNNIHVTLDEEDNYIVNCKYKNINNVFSLITAIIDDVFYRMFEQTFEAKIECEIK